MAVRIVICIKIHVIKGQLEIIWCISIVFVEKQTGTALFTSGILCIRYEEADWSLVLFELLSKQALVYVPVRQK